MNLTVQRTDLLTGLHGLASVISSRNTLPVLGMALWCAEENGLRLTATDLDRRFTCRIPAKVNQPVETICVPLERTLSIARAVEAEELHVTADTSHRLKLEGGSSRFLLLGVAGEEFPPDVRPEGSQVIGRVGFKAEALVRALQHTLFAASRNDGRENMEGVLWESDGKGDIHCVATNGRMLAHDVLRPTNPAEPLPEARVLLPGDTADTLVRLLASAEGDCAVTLETGHRITAEWGDHRFTGKLSESEFPKWRQVLPDGGDTLTLGVEALKQAVRQASALMDPAKNHIALGIEAGTIRVCAHSALGDAAIPVAFSGACAAQTLQFSHPYLSAILSALPGGALTLGIRVDPAPVTFRSGTLECVLMPLRVSE